MKDIMQNKLNAITGGLLAIGSVLTIKDISAILGILAIIIAIVVNILSYFNKKKEKHNIELERKKIITETKLLDERLKKLLKENDK
jgi:formiminotetrahydrofolate cyclodeaminase|tara:strand:- start:3212 stop:3469 length:258 start_codon:yes stop_codon:yes gene_type:complete